MLPVLVALPFWAIVYAGAFGTAETGAEGVVNGAQVFASNCASCHGARGVGGVGPSLTNGDAKLTFPERGRPHRLGRGRLVDEARTSPTATRRAPAASGWRMGGMPSFEGTLNDAQIRAVVEYERGL